LIWIEGSFNMSKYWEGNSLGKMKWCMYVFIYVVLTMCTRKITISMHLCIETQEWNFNYV
jgi:hypothetical protein